jgi:hypothetical protein
VARFAITAAALTAFFALFYIFVFSFPSGGAVLLLAALAFLGCVRALVGARSPARAANLAIAVSVATITYIASLRDDLPIPTLMFLAVLPILAAYAVSSRAAKVWAIAACVIAVVFAARFAAGLAHRALNPTPTEITTADTAALVGFIVIVWQVARAVGERRRHAEESRLELLSKVHYQRHVESVGRVVSQAAQDIRVPVTWIADALDSAIDALTSRSSDKAPDPETLSALREAREGLAEVRRVVDEMTARAAAPASPRGEVEHAGPSEVQRR